MEFIIGKGRFQLNTLKIIHAIRDTIETTSMKFKNVILNLEKSIHLEKKTAIKRILICRKYEPQILKSKFINITKKIAILKRVKG